MVKLTAACAALAGLSLLLPSEASYDPWAWLVWGRELASLELDTLGGPSWKPLPSFFAALISPLANVDNDIPPKLWMFVARFGALLALALAFRLTFRFTREGLGSVAGDRPRVGLALGVLAGTAAAGALALTPDWFQFSAQGSEAPLAVALVLWGVDRHLEGKPGQALVLGTLACLMRPELFLFLAPYAAFLWFAQPRYRALTAGLFLLLPLSWLVPEWLSAGDPLDGGAQARSEPFWSLSNHESPWKRATLRVHHHAGPALELLSLVAVGVALLRRQWTVLLLAVAAGAEIALYLAMTELGFSGNPRYVLPALVVMCMLGGVGAARTLELGGLAFRGAARALGAAPRPWIPAAGAALALAAIALLAAPNVQERVRRLQNEQREVSKRMELHRDLVAALEAAGGPELVRSYGPVTASRSLHTRIAWELGRPMDEMEKAHGRGVVFKSSYSKLAGRVHVWGRPRQRRFLAQVGTWHVFLREGVPEWIYIRGVAWAFTRSLQGIDKAPGGESIAVGGVVTK